MALTAVLLAVVAGSIVYCILTMVAARDYLVGRTPGPRGSPWTRSSDRQSTSERPTGASAADQGVRPTISVLKPLHGAEDQLEENLRSFFSQRYQTYEILFAVRHADDPAVAVVEKLRREYPTVPVQVIITGEPPYPNAKVFSLDRMKSAARYELLVMSDSDIRATPEMLATMAAEFSDPRVGVTTCPYRAVPGPGPGLWSKLEALGMNTQFLGGVLVARMLEGMKFALGPTIAARKSVLDEMGGFDRLKDYLAEDFVMGKFAAELGHRVLLSSYVIEHHIGDHGFTDNLRHRLRWARSTRRSRPAGYVGEMFTMPLPPALLLWAWSPLLWPVVILALALRACSAWACAGWVLGDRLTARLWWLLPVQDVLAFVIWIAGFFGNHIAWRGRRYLLHADGRFERV